MNRVNPVTAVERAIDYLAKPLAGVIKRWEGMTWTSSPALHGNCESKDAARLGRAVLRDPLWIRLLSLRPSPPHPPGWVEQQHRDAAARTEIQRRLREGRQP